MTTIQILGLGGVLTLLGMVIIFGFLVFLIITGGNMGKNRGKTVPTVPTVPTAPTVPAALTTRVKTGTAAPAVSVNDASIIAVISAAVNEYRRLH